MLKFDKTNNLLMQFNYHYTLQDVAQPNLYRELYDYSHVPKVAFNMRHVPMQMPDEIWMTDTTFRDGQQSVSPFTPEQILHLFKLARANSSSIRPLTRRRCSCARTRDSLSRRSPPGSGPMKRTLSWSKRPASRKPASSFPAAIIIFSIKCT